MHPFGGTQICPRCSKAVYAAEQVMGPGRKLYHKPCLSCMTCKKRLDSYMLVEHDQEPYCKSCYTKNFSPRDLRKANLPVRETSIPEISSSPPGTSNNKSNIPSLPPRITSPVQQSSTSAFPLPRLKPTRSRHSPTSSTFPQTARSYLDKVEETQSTPLSNQPDPLPEHEEVGYQVTPLTQSSSAQPNRSVPLLPNRPTHRSSNSASSLSNVRSFQPETKDSSNPSFPTTGRSNNTNTASAALNLLEKEGISPLPQTATGTRYGTALGGTITIDMAGTPIGSSPARKWNMETPICPKCSQRVYFAEQVKAVGKTWHKICLRCQECNTSLDSNRLRDHDGIPFCVRCYSKLHGPQGSGYALLGKAGG